MRNKLISSIAGAAFSFVASGFAFAADMAVKAMPPVPAPVPYTWTGFYGGLNVGWSWGQAKDGFDLTSVLGGPPGTVFTDSTHPNGAIGGIQIGYNWQATPNWILGFETDIQASGESASNSFQQTLTFNGGTTTASIFHNEALEWFGTVRGRVGYAIWRTAIFYATGGLAYGNISESVSNLKTNTAPGFIAISNPLLASTTRTGWTAGGGIEGAVPDTHVTWKVEYLYIDLGTANYNVLGFTRFPPGFPVGISTRFTDNVVRVGLNYQFH